MGSYVFRWPYPANDVHVTGTFDDWGKTEQLNKVGDIWEKEVFLPSADEKILYKFVVDDLWVVDDKAAKEDDGHNNENNVLYPQDIKRREMTSSAPGAFPETPATDQAFNIQPIPATGGTGNPVQLPPGEKVPDSKDVTSNTVESTVTISKEDYEKAGNESEVVSVNPIPASTGLGNPVQLPPGEKVPDPKDITPNTVTSTVTTSQDDFDKAGQDTETVSVNPIAASAGFGNPVNLPPGQPIPSDVNQNSVTAAATTSQEDYEKAGTSSLPAVLGAGAAVAAGAGGIAAATALKRPEGNKNIIPESSLPMGGSGTDTLDAGPFISSAAPGTSAAELAANVPLEKNRADPFVSSAAPGTSAADLAANVPLQKTEAAPFVSSAAPGTSAADLASKVPLEKPEADPFISSAAPGTSAAALAGQVPLEQKRQGMVVDPKDIATTSVPETVQQSIGQAHQDPEAAASAEAVREKTDVEKELLSKVKQSDASGLPASAAAQQSSYHGLATSVPQTVEDSMVKANAAPEAAANSSIVAEKSAVEKELLTKIPSSSEAGEPAPTLAAATSAISPATTSAVPISLTDGKIANQPIPSSDTSTTTRGLSAGELAGGAAASATAASGFDAATKRHEDSNAEPPRVADAQKPDVTTEISPADTRVGTAKRNTAMSDVTADASLADEPAVRLMNQNENSSTIPNTHTSGSNATDNVSASSATAAASGVPTLTNDRSQGTKTEAAQTSATAPASTPSTPAKQSSGTAVVDSPASTAATDKSKKKHRHRISAFFKKVFD